MKRFTILQSSGDTIVEVLVVLAVLSLSCTISYATASHSLSQSRNSDEHSQALGILNAQVELLRAAVNAQNTSVFSLPEAGSPGPAFCLSSPTSVVGSFSSSYNHNDPKSDDITSNGGDGAYPAACVQGDTSLYHVSIEYIPVVNPNNPSDTTQNYFDLLVRWQGLGDLGVQQEELTYDINQASTSLTAPGYTDTPPVSTPNPPVPNLTIGTGDIGSSSSSVTVVPGQSMNLYWSVGDTLPGGADGSTTCTASDTANDPGDGWVGPQSARGGSVQIAAPSTPGTYSYTLSCDNATLEGNSSVPATVTADVVVWQNWTINGDDWNTCTQTEMLFGDGLDGCFTTGTSMYAYREFKDNYLISSGTLTPSSTTITSGLANMSISYNQFTGTPPPSGYPAYQINVQVYSQSSTDCGNENQGLPITDDSNSYTARTETFPISLTCDNPKSITIQWLNNCGLGVETCNTDGDPNLQINSVGLANQHG